MSSLLAKQEQDQQKEGGTLLCKVLVSGSLCPIEGRGDTIIPVKVKASSSLRAVHQHLLLAPALASALLLPTPTTVSDTSIASVSDEDNYWYSFPFSMSKRIDFSVTMGALRGQLLQERGGDEPLLLCLHKQQPAVTSVSSTMVFRVFDCTSTEPGINPGSELAEVTVKPQQKCQKLMVKLTQSCETLQCWTLADLSFIALAPGGGRVELRPQVTYRDLGLVSDTILRIERASKE